jgi:hypothetical protein
MARTPRYPDEGMGAGTGGSDGLPEKLIKYVPAETLAFFLPAVALAKATPNLLWAALVIGAVGTVAYLYSVRSQTNPPRVYFYVLAFISFLVWALATNAPIQTLIGVSADVAGFILLVAVFLIPVVDKIITDRR